MPTYALANTTAWSTDSTTVLATIYATRISVLADSTATHLRWYRTNTTSAQLPTRLALYRSDGTLLYTAAAVPDNLAVQWQSHTIARPIALYRGEVYYATMDWSAAHGQEAFTLVANLVQPAYPLHIENPCRAYTQPGSGTFPSTTDNVVVHGVDLGVEVGLPVNPPPATGGDVANSLADWLITTGDNTHQSDGLPWRTDANVTTIKSEAQGATGFDAIKAVADSISAVVGGVPGTLVNGFTTVTGQLATMTGNITQTAIATLGSISHDMQIAIVHTEDTLAALAGVKAGAGTFPSAVGPLTWTLLDEQDFTGNLAYAQPADLYALTVTTPANGQAINDVAGVNVIYRAGWWSPLNGSFMRQRRYFDGQDNHLEIGGERMPGVLIGVPPDLVGHIQAWGLS